MKSELSRRTFMGGTLKTVAAASLALAGTEGATSAETAQNSGGIAAAGAGRIVDIHLHYKPTPGFIDDYLRATEHLNYTACMLTPFENRKEVAEAAKKHPGRIIPMGGVLLDEPDVTQQIAELHDLGFRGLGEMEFPKKTYVDPAYTKVYELANRYK